MCSFIYTPENYAWHIVSSQQLAKVRWRFAKLRYFWGKIRGKMVFEVLYLKTFFLYYNSYFNISSLIFMSLPGHLFEGLLGQRFPSPSHWTVSELQKVNLKFQCTCNKRQKLTLHNKASRSEERKKKSRSQITKGKSCSWAVNQSIARPQSPSEPSEFRSSSPSPSTWGNFITSLSLNSLPFRLSWELGLILRSA